jgi:predicted RND superfamily exporter protein
VASLEKSLFGGLGEVSALAQRLAVMQPPGVNDLEPQLLHRFVAQDGTWRIEVMPRSGTGELSFAAALRRAVPQASGEPIVSLVRNEMIHHEAILALATALLAASALVLVTLRSLRGMVLSMAPAAAFTTLTASVTVMLNISLNAAMLAGVSAAMAVLISCSMLVAVRLRGSGAAVRAQILPLRAVLLPPITLAGAVAPLVISSRPAVAELGASLALLFLIVALLVVLLVPALARWLDLLAEPSPQPAHRK